MKQFSAIAQTLALTSFSALSLLAAPAQAASFRGLGSLSSTSISADGSVIVGNSGSQAFRWTQEDGMIGLGSLGGTFSTADGVSADGSVVVGYSNHPNGYQIEAFRWTQVDGMLGLGFFMMMITIPKLGEYQPMALLLLAIITVLMDFKHFVGLNRVAWLLS